MATLLSRHASGVYAVAPTPFTPEGDVDHASFERLLDCYQLAGVTGVTVLGQMGEAPKLAQAEALRLVEQATRRDLPVVVGVTAPGFAAMRSLTNEVMERGAAGVLIAPPVSLRTDDQIVDYYADAVAAVGTDVPFAVQDYPLTFTVQMTPGVIGRIARAHSSCVMLKHEDWPGLEKISALRAAEVGGQPRLSILCGNGGLFLDFELDRGADGAMTGYCFPELLTRIVAHRRAGEAEALHDLFDAHLPLLRYEQQPGVGLAVRKHVFARRGIIDSDAQRTPGKPLTPAARAEVDRLLVRLARRDECVAKALQGASARRQLESFRRLPPIRRHVSLLKPSASAETRYRALRHWRPSSGNGAGVAFSAVSVAMRTWPLTPCIAIATRSARTVRDELRWPESGSAQAVAPALHPTL